MLTNRAHPLFARHLALEPEEARSLGLPAEGTRDLRRGDERRALHEAIVADPTAPPALVRVAAIALDRADERIDLERTCFPAWTGTPDVAGYLAAHEDLCREGLARGERPDRQVVAHFVEDQIPALLGAAAPAERPAWERHLAFVRDELGPRAVEGAWRLGEVRYRQRLARYGVEASLAPRAREVLAETRDALCAHLGVADFGTAADRLRAFAEPRLADPVGAYREANRRLVALVRSEGIHDLPAGFEVRIERVPPGMDAVTHAGNRPAPLLGDGDAAFLVADDPARHPRHWAGPLAAHEGVPGHTLQSVAWQRRFRDAGAPPHAFLSVPDAIASERGDWGAMLAIEGWAVWAEERVRRTDFHTFEGQAAALSFHALRCVRALVDEGLHVGSMTEDEAVRLYEAGAGLPPAHAAGELVRARRVPTQLATYFAGWDRIDRLVRESGLPERRATACLLDAGPLLPDTLAPSAS